MFQASSPSVACPSCGKRNSARLSFCTACAGRLGKEPSIAPAPQQAAAAASVAQPRNDTRNDTRFGAPRTVHSRPMAVGAPSAESNPLGFWFKFCMTGLVLMIAFITWAIYTMTGSRSVAPLPSTQLGAAQVPDTAPATPPAVAAVKPPEAPVASVTPAPVAPAPVAPSPVAPAPVAPPTVAAAPAASAIVAAAAGQAAPQQQASAARRQAWRERARSSAQDTEETAAARAGAWVMPDRPPVSTSAPGFQDAGPPIVPGPGPAPVFPLYGSGVREAALAARPSSPSVPSGAVSSGSDLGPPVAAGPGPQYDFSTPGANRR